MTPGFLAAVAPGGPIKTSLAEAFFIQRHPITENVEWLGSLIIWLLMALSAGCLGLIGALLLECRRERFLAAAIDDAVAAANAAAPQTDARLHAADEALEQFTTERTRRLEPLGVVGSVAPMIGLFGTVYGMILAFRQIVVAGGSPDPVNLAAGIGTALTTTFWGLVVAIPALAGHAILRSRIEALTLAAWREIERRIAPAPTADAADARAEHTTAEPAPAA